MNAFTNSDQTDSNLFDLVLRLFVPFPNVFFLSRFHIPFLTFCFHVLGFTGMFLYEFPILINQNIYHLITICLGNRFPGSDCISNPVSPHPVCLNSKRKPVPLILKINRLYEVDEFESLYRLCRYNILAAETTEVFLSRKISSFFYDYCVFTFLFLPPLFETFFSPFHLNFCSPH